MFSGGGGGGVWVGLLALMAIRSRVGKAERPVCCFRENWCSDRTKKKDSPFKNGAGASSRMSAVAALMRRPHGRSVQMIICTEA